MGEGFPDQTQPDPTRPGQTRPDRVGSADRICAPNGNVHIYLSCFDFALIFQLFFFHFCSLFSPLPLSFSFCFSVYSDFYWCPLC